MPPKKLTLNSLLDLSPDDGHHFSAKPSKKVITSDKKPMRSLFTFDVSDDEEEIHHKPSLKTKHAVAGTKDNLSHELSSLEEKVKSLTKSVHTLTTQVQKVTEVCAELARSHEVLQEKTVGSVGVVAS